VRAVVVSWRAAHFGASRLCWVWRERSGARCYGRQARQGFTSSCCTLARNRSQEDELV
jgi:hypothetical protein